MLHTEDERPLILSTSHPGGSDPLPTHTNTPSPRRNVRAQAKYGEQSKYFDLQVCVLSVCVLVLCVYVCFVCFGPLPRARTHTHTQRASQLLLRIPVCVCVCVVCAVLFGAV